MNFGVSLAAKQSAAIHAYITARNKYKGVTMIQAGASVDNGAWEIAHDAAGAVVSAFGVEHVGPLDAVLELLCEVKEPPSDERSVAALVRGIADASRSQRSWARWCDHHPSVAKAA